MQEVGVLLLWLLLSKGHSMAMGFNLNSRASSSLWFSGSRISILELGVFTVVDLHVECCVLGECRFFGLETKKSIMHVNCLID